MILTWRQAVDKFKGMKPVASGIDVEQDMMFMRFSGNQWLVLWEEDGKIELHDCITKQKERK